MNKPVGDLMPESEIGAPAVAVTGLALLRAPFPPNQISKRPKETRAQADRRKADQDKGQWPAICTVCGGRHHPQAVHLDYVGHAALTDRLLDADPRWTWEPVPDPASHGLPTAPGGMWIKLTVDGVTRYGFGHPDGKSGGDAVKETIGDAMRNAAMRFGAALDLWHKGDLHTDAPADAAPSLEEQAVNLLRGASGSRELFKDAWARNKDGWKAMLDRDAYGRVVKVMREVAEKLAEAPSPEPVTPVEAHRPGANASAAAVNGERFQLDDEIPF